MSEEQDIKNKVLKGGIFLTLRQLLSSGLSVVSVLVIARVLGPEKYGIVASSLGIFYFLSWTGQMGLNMYLVRQSDPRHEEAEQLLAFYNTVGVLFCVLIWICAPLFGLWTGVPEVSRVMRWLMPAVWLHMVGEVSNGILARDLKFDQVSIVGGVSQVANYLVSVPIVLLTGSFWGPIIGIILQFFVKAILAYAFHPIHLTLVWRWSCLKKILAYGIPFFMASWTQSLRTLTIPLIITPLVGVGAAGIVGVTTRMVDQLFLVRKVIHGMSVSVMAKLMGDSKAVQRAIEQGMSYIALLLILVLASFACISPWLIPLLFGNEWYQSTKIFPFIAFAASVGAIFDLHQATLHAVGKNHIVMVQYLLFTGLLWLSCWLLIPPLGLWGYAAAEIIALPSFWVSHWAFSSLYSPPGYRNVVFIFSAAIPSLIACIFFPPAVSFIILFFSFSLLLKFSLGVRKVLFEMLAMIKLKRHKEKLDAT